MNVSKQRNTFYLLGCESCERFATPPEPVKLPNFVEPASEPMRCTICNNMLLLVECWIADESVMWQEKPGAIWHHVAFIDRLPTRNGRSIWV